MSLEPKNDGLPNLGIEEKLNSPDVFLNSAKSAVILAEQNRRLEVFADQLYIVWFSKTLQNWKALLSTDRHDGVYYEVTYNGDRGEAYVDVYQKQYNTAIPRTAIHNNL